MTEYSAIRTPGDRQMAPLDDIDLQIVAALRADGRLSVRALAEALHISRASAYARVKRLETSRVITGYTAIVDPRRCGYGLSAYVFLKIAQESWQTVGRQVLSIPAERTADRRLRGSPAPRWPARHRDRPAARRRGRPRRDLRPGQAHPLQQGARHGARLRHH